LNNIAQESDLGKTKMSLKGKKAETCLRSNGRGGLRIGYALNLVKIYTLRTKTKKDSQRKDALKKPSLLTGVDHCIERGSRGKKERFC